MRPKHQSRRYLK